MYLEETLCCLLNCRTFGGSRVQGSNMYLQESCVDYLIVRPSVGQGIRPEDVS